MAAGGQTVVTGTYNNLTLDNTSSTDTAGGGLTVNGTLTTTSGGTLDMSTYTLGGTLSTITNNGTIKTSATGATPIPANETWGGTVQYNGSVSQTAVAGTYNNLTINNSAGVSLTGDVTVNAILSFTSGIIVTSTNKVILGSSATVSGAGAGKYVNGNLRRYVPNSAAPTVVYDIGDATNYTPVSVTFVGTVSGSGYLDASTAVYQPPAASGISQTQYINRKWTLTNTGVGCFTSYSPTFTFVNGDEVGIPEKDIRFSGKEVQRIHMVNNNHWSNNSK